MTCTKWSVTESNSAPNRLPVLVARATRPRGAIVRPLGDVVVLMPPLAMTGAELRRLVAATAAAIEEATSAALATLSPPGADQ